MANGYAEILNEWHHRAFTVNHGIIGNTNDEGDAYVLIILSTHLHVFLNNILLLDNISMIGYWYWILGLHVIALTSMLFIQRYYLHATCECENNYDVPWLWCVHWHTIFFESISILKYKLLLFQVVISVLASIWRTSLSTLIDELNPDDHVNLSQTKLPELTKLKNVSRLGF